MNILASCNEFRHLLPVGVAIWVAVIVLAGAPPLVAVERPNIVLIFTDDQGYQDLGCYGSTTIKTPNLDRLADEGLRLTSFYAQPVCGVSRAALMTGCYPIRVAEPGNVKRLHTVPHPDEITMAEVLKSAGYATALIGKWHLCEKKADGPGGFDPATMPNSQGFDYYYGTPLYNGFTVFVADTKFRSPIFRNQEIVVDKIENWDHITQDYTREALAWIEKNRDRPFFLYLAHNMPHIPVGASENFKGKSAYGPYGDTIEEIDWSCGEIVSKLRQLGLDEKTLIVFTSDNGPWIETTHGMTPDGKPFIPRNHSGTADPLRGWKMSAWDGGSRVPCLMRWPGRIPAGCVSDELVATMDLLPTFAALAGADLPDRELDGNDASAFLLGQSHSPRNEYLYYTGCLLTGVRSGPWKLVLPRPANPPGTGWWGRMIEAVPERRLYNLDDDPGETTDVAAEHPEVVEQLVERIRQARQRLGDMDCVGSGARFFDEGERSPMISNRRSQTGKLNSSEYDGYQPLGDLRFTFESGTLEGWRLVEGTLGKPISQAVSLPRWKQTPFNQEGQFHLSTVDTGEGFSDKQTAVLESPCFVLSGDKAAFLVSGGFDREALYVGLCDARSGEVLLRAGGTAGPQMRRVVWDVRDFNGRNLFLRIVDSRTSGWAHLTFDDFSAQGRLAPEAQRQATEAIIEQE